MLIAHGFSPRPLARALVLLVCWSLALSSVAAPGAQQSPERLMELARHADVSDGDLERALELYRQVVDGPGTERELVARALLAMGDCYERLGDAGATAAYRRIVDEFPDVPAAASRARARLETLAAGGSEGPRQLPGLDSSVVWHVSPDGRRAALTVYDEFGQNIGIFDYETLEATMLTNRPWSEQRMADFPRWSPDGEWLAYVETSGEDTAVVVVAPGGEPRTVARFSTGTAGVGIGGAVTDWLPDGERLVVSRLEEDGRGSVGLLSLATGELSRRYSGPEWPLAAAASPDGRWLAVAVGNRGSQDILLLPVEGGEGIRVTDHPSNDQNPIFSPDGEYLLFTSNRQGTRALWARRLEAHGPVGAPVLVRAGFEGQLLAWGGGELHYTADLTTRDIMVAAVERSEGDVVIAQPHLVPHPETGRNLVPEFSPDGSTLAFIAWPWGERPTRLVLQPLDGGQARSFPVPQQLRYPMASLRWNPDSGSIAFLALGADQQTVMARLDLATGRWSFRSLPDARAQAFEWNRQGTGFYYVRVTESGPESMSGSDLVEASVEETAERVVMSFEDTVRDLRRTRMPDGGDGLLYRLADAEQIGRLSLATRQAETLGAGRSPSSSPDGRYVLSAVGMGTDAVSLQIIDTVEDTVRPVPIDPSELLRDEVGGAAESVNLWNTAWSPDGSRIAFALLGFRDQRVALPDPLVSLSER